MASTAATLVGQVVTIAVGAPPERITIRADSREIDCVCPTSLHDQIAGLSPGSIVEVAGEAAINSQGQVERLDRLDSISTFSPGPLRITRFEHDGIVFSLKEPLVVNVEFTDGLWVYHNSPLNLWGSGERREEAIADLHDNFAFLWQELAEERDEKLDSRAQDIKRLLLDLAVTRSET